MKLILVGQGNMELDLREKSKELGVQNRVIFAGLQRDIPKISSVFDVFLFPSKREGLGIVTIEMQALGIPWNISEGVPKEVDMGVGLVTQIPLENSERWIEEIERKNCPKLSWRLRQKKIEQKGYEIKESIRCLEEIYCGEGGK